MIGNFFSFCTVVFSILTLIALNIDFSNTTNVVLIVLASSSIVGTISSIATSIVWRTLYREQHQLIMTALRKGEK